MASKVYDFVVGGGSVAGLTFATEASKKGASVLVAEEHEEIGEPEKCDGLVSLRGLRRWGYPPHPEVVQNEVAAAVIHTPGGRHFAVGASSLEVVVLDRSAYDKQLAHQAEASGATILTGARVRGAADSTGGVSVKIGDAAVASKFYVDATGPSPKHRKGILPAAKYEVQGDWVSERIVDIYLDADKYPGFFGWIIPYGGHRAKIGVAGRGINPYKALDSLIGTRQTTVLSRVSAPIYVGGPTGRFVDGRTIYVGESAGEVKPTTAGGIMTSIGGSVIAARWASDAIQKRDRSLLDNYGRDWQSTFQKEMSAMLRLRGVFEKLSNTDIEALVDVLAAPKLVSRLSNSDFDFHATALLGALGMQGVLRVARVVGSAEIRSLVGRDRSG